MLARQALYHLNHTFNPFYFSHFSKNISQFCPELASDYSPLTYAFYITGITGVHTTPDLLVEMSLCQLFCLT
jgi:hypothetical protein